MISITPMILFPPLKCLTKVVIKIMVPSKLEVKGRIAILFNAILHELYAESPESSVIRVTNLKQGRRQ